MPARIDSALAARIDSLSSIFTPRSVAIVGASDTRTKIGGIPVDFLKRFGYLGAIHPVNPKPGLVQGSGYRSFENFSNSTAVA